MKRWLIAVIVCVATLALAGPPPVFVPSGNEVYNTAYRDSFVVYFDTTGGTTSVVIYGEGFGWSRDTILSRATLDSLVKALGRFASGNWNWEDSSSHGPDSVLFADSANHADSATGAERATTADSTDAITDGGVDMADIGQASATDRQIIFWDNGNTTWTPGDSAPYAGAATFSDSTDAITDRAVDMEDIEQSGATSGQVIKWDGSNWAPAADAGGGAATIADTLGYSGGSTSGGHATFGNDAATGRDSFLITAIQTNDSNYLKHVFDTNTGQWIISGGTGPLVTDSMKALTALYVGTEWFGSLTGPGLVQQPGDSVLMVLVDSSTIDFVGNALEVPDGGITTNEIADATITRADIAQDGATDGKILKWETDSSKWIIADDGGGSGTAQWTERDSNSIFYQSTGEGTPGDADTTIVVRDSTDWSIIEGNSENDSGLWVKADRIGNGAGLAQADTFQVNSWLRILIGTDSLVFSDTMTWGDNWFFYIDTAAGKADTIRVKSAVSDVDTSGTQIQAGLNQRVSTLGDTTVADKRWDWQNGTHGNIDSLGADTLDTDLILADTVLTGSDKIAEFVGVGHTLSAGSLIVSLGTSIATAEIEDDAVTGAKIGANEVDDQDIDFGTGSNQVDMTDMRATNWRMFHSNGTGIVTELALGTNYQILRSTGASSAPEWWTMNDSVLGADTNRVLFSDRVDTTTAGLVLDGGNIAMAGAETVDGVDISALDADVAADSGDWNKAWDTLQKVLDDTTDWLAVEESVYVWDNRGYPPAGYGVYGVVKIDNNTLDTSALGKLEVKFEGITQSHIATSGVGPSEIAAGAVRTGEIYDDSVCARDINWGTTAAESQVNTDSIPEGAVNKFDQALPDSANWSIAYDSSQFDFFRSDEDLDPDQLTGDVVDDNLVDWGIVDTAGLKVNNSYDADSLGEVAAAAYATEAEVGDSVDDRFHIADFDGVTVDTNASGQLTVSRSVAGDVDVTGRVNDGGSFHRLDLNAIYLVPPESALVMDPHYKSYWDSDSTGGGFDYTDSTNAAHVSSFLSPGSLFDYPYIIIYTPLWSGQKEEVPCMQVCTDGINYHYTIDSTPGSGTFGDTFSIPLFHYGDDFDGSAGHPSDGDAFFDADQNLYVMCRYGDLDAGATTTHKLRAKHTSNLYTWTDTLDNGDVIDMIDSAAGVNMWFISPSVTFTGSSEYKMWAIERYNHANLDTADWIVVCTTNGVEVRDTNNTALFLWENDVPDTGWTLSTSIGSFAYEWNYNIEDTITGPYTGAVLVTGIPDGYHIWHAKVKKYINTNLLLAIFCCSHSSSPAGGDSTRLILAQSINGGRTFECADHWLWEPATYDTANVLGADTLCQPCLYGGWQNRVYRADFNIEPWNGDFRMRILGAGYGCLDSNNAGNCTKTWHLNQAWAYMNPDDKDATIYKPGDINDTITFFTVDSLTYPYGIALRKLHFSTIRDTAYTLEWQTWDGDPWTFDSVVASHSTGATEAYDELIGWNNIKWPIIAPGDKLRLHLPATGVDELTAKIVFYPLGAE